MFITRGPNAPHPARRVAVSRPPGPSGGRLPAVRPVRWPFPAARASLKS